MANSPSKYGPKNQPETYSNNDGNFNINIPIQTTETFDPWECPGFTFIAGALYVPDNIKYNQPTEVPVIVSSEELTEFEYQNYVVDQNFKFQNFTPAEQEVIKSRIIEDDLSSDERCINVALGILNTTPLPDYLSIDNTQMRNITGQVVGEVPDDNSNASTQGVYNVTVYTADDFGGTPSKNVVRVKTDTNGYFSMSVPKDTKFISARIKSDAANATPDSFLVDSVEFNSDKDYYLLQLKLQQVDEVKINIGGGYEAPTRPPTLLITAEGYESKEIIPYKGDGTPKTDIGIIELIPIDKSLENDIIESSQLSQDNVKKITSPKKTADYYIQKRLFKVVQNLKDTLIPIVLTLLAKFGITAAQSIIGKGKEAMKEAIQNKTYCPPQSEISLIIQKKNRIVNGLNNSLKIIDATTIALGIVGGLLTGLEIALNFIVITPIPTPPAIPVAITKSEKLIAKLKAGNAGLLAILVLLRQTIIIIIDLLSLLDMAIEDCSPDTEEKQEEINAELLALVEEQKANNSPVIKIVNGFTMGIETENTTESLKRKRATATNADGVVILRGEWSFSSIEQILIDELVFYIQVNDLKAD